MLKSPCINGSDAIVFCMSEKTNVEFFVSFQLNDWVSPSIVSAYKLRWLQAKRMISVWFRCWLGNRLTGVLAFLVTSTLPSTISCCNKATKLYVQEHCGPLWAILDVHILWRGDINFDCYFVSDRQRTTTVQEARAQVVQEDLQWLHIHVVCHQLTLGKLLYFILPLMSSRNNLPLRSSVYYLFMSC